ncbi:MAG: MmcQ/YjbR family DNA-binding protein [Planctomycetia bacterium]|nr:MmcQ/YjbR family DNA-binding protein [Planctomycetia bacterium]
MDFNILNKYLLSKKSSVSSYPFDDTTLVFKVMNKMFALIAEDANPLRINLKCDPEDAQILRGMHASIIPGYHMNKEHWNTVILDESLPNNLVYKMIDDSYDLVVKGLKKVDREMLL